jgi:hypothetical protein
MLGCVAVATGSNHSLREAVAACGKEDRDTAMVELSPLVIVFAALLVATLIALGSIALWDTLR